MPRATKKSKSDLDLELTYRALGIMYTLIFTCAVFEGEIKWITHLQNSFFKSKLLHNTTETHKRVANVDNFVMVKMYILEKSMSQGLCQ